MKRNTSREVIRLDCCCNTIILNTIILNYPPRHRRIIEKLLEFSRDITSVKISSDTLTFNKKVMISDIIYLIISYNICQDVISDNIRYNIRQDIISDNILTAVKILSVAGYYVSLFIPTLQTFHSDTTKLIGKKLLRSPCWRNYCHHANSSLSTFCEMVVSQHVEGSSKSPPETRRTSRQYSIEGLNGTLNWSLLMPRGQCRFLPSLTIP